MREADGRSLDELNHPAYVQPAHLQPTTRSVAIDPNKTRVLLAQQSDLHKFEQDLIAILRRVGLVSVTTTMKGLRR